MTETVNQYQSDFVTIKQTTNGRPPEGGTRSYVVDLRGLLNRRHELILESRRSKPLMSLQVETWSCESASRWPSGHWVTCPPDSFDSPSETRLTPVSVLIDPGSVSSFASQECSVVFHGCCCVVLCVPAWSLWSGSRHWRVSLWASLSGRRRPNEMQICRFTRYGQNKTDVYIRGLDSVRILEAWGKKKKKLWMFPRSFPVQLKESLFNFFFSFPLLLQFIWNCCNSSWNWTDELVFNEFWFIIIIFFNLQWS